MRRPFREMRGMTCRATLNPHLVSCVSRPRYLWHRHLQRMAELSSSATATLPFLSSKWLTLGSFRGFLYAMRTQISPRALVTSLRGSEAYSAWRLWPYPIRLASSSSSSGAEVEASASILTSQFPLSLTPWSTSIL